MTIQGAIAELQNLLNADDIPIYYKGGIEKVIETIQMEVAEQIENCSEKPNNCEDEPQTDNGIGCSRCEGRFWCMDRDMPHAVHCNNYGKITDCPKSCPSRDICTKDATDCAWKEKNNENS